MSQRIQQHNSQSVGQQQISQADGTVDRSLPVIEHRRHYCAACSLETADQSDICEQCGYWQLPGQCCFCYARVETGYAFCPECGNPPTGKQCPTCHTRSLFDFCPGCDTALTQQAIQTIELIQSSDAIQVLRAIITGAANINEHVEPAKPPVDTDIQALQSFLTGWSAQKLDEDEAALSKFVAKTAAFTLQVDTNAADRIRQLTELEQQEALVAQNWQSTAKQQEQLQQQLSALQQKTFTNNQEARRYYSALKAIIPKVYEMSLIKVVPPKPVGWRCRAFNVVHSDGPSGCAKPSDGGDWVYVK